MKVPITSDRMPFPHRRHVGLNIKGMTFLCLGILISASGCLGYHGAMTTYGDVLSTIILNPVNGTISLNTSNNNSTVMEISRNNCTVVPNPSEMGMTFILNNIFDSNRHINGSIFLNSSEILLKTRSFKDAVTIKGDRNSASFKKVDGREKAFLKTYDLMIINISIKIYDVNVTSEQYDPFIKSYYVD